MRLRDLELKDAPLMLEWMHDKSVVSKLKGNFIEKTLEIFCLLGQKPELRITQIIQKHQDRSGIYWDPLTF